MVSLRRLSTSAATSFSVPLRPPSEGVLIRLASYWLLDPTSRLERISQQRGTYQSGSGVITKSAVEISLEGSEVGFELVDVAQVAEITKATKARATSGTAQFLLELLQLLLEAAEVVEVDVLGIHLGEHALELILDLLLGATETKCAELLIQLRSRVSRDGCTGKRRQENRSSRIHCV